MKYYKIIQDSNFIDVVNSLDFIRYSIYDRTFMGANETNGQFIECQGKLYRATWMVPTPNDINIEFEEATIREIDEQEYNSLKRAIEQDEEIPVEEEIVPIIIPNIDENEVITIEYMRATKLQEMSYACRAAIEAGFDLVLRSESSHFSLTTQDQLNLMSLGTAAQTQSLIPYHADGEECVFYTAEEINQIIAAANDFKNYQLAYYNSLKAYINELDTIEAIAAITYGTPIPDEYKSDVLRVLE